MKLGSQFETLKLADGGLCADKDEIMGVQSDGTTIISMKYKGGILIGADSRSSNVRDNYFLQITNYCIF